MTNTTKTEGIAVYSRLLVYVKRYWFFFAIGIIGTIGQSGVDAGLTWSLKPLLDQGFIARDKVFIEWLPMFVIIAVILRGTAGFMSDYFITAVGRNVVSDFRQQVFKQFLRLPASYYDNTSSGQLLSTLIYNIEQVAKASSDALLILVRDSFFILGLLVVMISASWKLTLLIFASAPFIAIISRYSSKKMRKFSRYLQTGMGNITHIAEESIEGYRVIRTFGGQHYETEKFTAAVKNNLRREMQLIATDALASPAVILMLGVVISLTVYIATKNSDHITAGGFASILASLLAIIKPLKNITTVNNTIQRGITGAESIFQLLDEKPEQDSGTIELVRAKGEVEYQHVEFVYHKHENKVLHDINFRIAPGQTIALVGKSGSGKTTLVSLLPHFYDNYTGKILIDGINIKDIKLQDLRNQFALVSQHVTLFNDTLGRNIAYGRFEQTSQEEIMAAAEAANAAEFIRSLPQGLDTLIGENGLLLSGGQRQRIAIARAILRNAPILILDEATSALDTESERHIQNALQRLMQNRTTFIIAHRLSTIENADKIFVLKDGRIVEVGTHSELILRGGEYAKLHALQFKEAPSELVHSTF